MAEDKIPDMRLLSIDEYEALRDRFAMAALTGILASRTHGSEPSGRICAKKAYDIADTMLEARKRGK
jgi:hypothetical protein